MLKSLSLFMLLLFAASVHAKTFTKIGEVAKASFRPQSSPIDFEYDVLYYVPEKLRGQTNLNALVFLHGGGQSTSTRSSSWRIVEMYSDDMIKIADELGIVLVMPSGSGINWGSHLLNYLRDLNATIRAELPVNPDKIGLSGHSMGAMGITRSSQWLTDEYAFFMPVAGGMDPKYAIEKYLATNFNTNYHHLQGLNDHFQVFVERCRNQEAEMAKLEKKYNRDSGLVMEYYNGSHNYPMPLFQTRLDEAFASAKRDLFQKELYGVFYYQDEVVTDQWSNGNPYYKAPRDSYFWVKVDKFSNEAEKKERPGFFKRLGMKVGIVKEEEAAAVASSPVITMKAKIDSAKNEVQVTMDAGSDSIKVLLSEKTLDLTSPVRIVVNGVEKYNEVPKANFEPANIGENSGYDFQSEVKINL